MLTLKLTVNTLPVLNFALAPDTICSSANPVIIPGTPTGGIYTGPGLTDSLFKPTLANLGLDTLTYAYTDSNHCHATATAVIDVVSMPDSINIGSVYDTVGRTTYFIQPAIPGYITWQQQVYYYNGDTAISASTGDSFSVYCYILGERPARIDTNRIDGPFTLRAVVNLFGCIDTLPWITDMQCQFLGGGVKEVSGATLFNISPNPANDYTTISFDAAYTGAIIFVKDVTGRQLYQTQLTHSPQQIPTATLLPGIYLVTMSTGEQVGARLLVKE